MCQHDDAVHADSALPDSAPPFANADILTDKNYVIQNSDNIISHAPSYAPFEFG
jgi:hypothetical protein